MIYKTCIGFYKLTIDINKFSGIVVIIVLDFQIYNLTRTCFE